MARAKAKAPSISDLMLEGSEGPPTTPHTWCPADTKLEIQFLGDPDDGETWSVLYTAWEDGKKSVSREKAKGYRPSALAVSVVDGRDEAQVFEMKVSVYKQLMKSFNAFGTLTGRVFQIERTGSGMDTEYSVLPLREELAPDVAFDGLLEQVEQEILQDASEPF